MFGKANELSLPAAGIKLGKLLSILKFRIKNIHWSAPHVRTTKMTVIFKLLPRELFKRRQPIVIRKVVKNPDGIVNCEGLELQIMGIRPVKCTMDEESSQRGRKSRREGACSYHPEIRKVT